MELISILVGIIGIMVMLAAVVVVLLAALIYKLYTEFFKQVAQDRWNSKKR